MPPAVISVSIVPASRVARVLHGVYPHDLIRVDPAANAVIVVAPPDDVAGMRSIAAGIDVKSPFEPQVEAIQLHTAKPQEVVARLHPLFQNVVLTVGPNGTIIVASTAQIISQVRTVANVLDTPPPPPTPRPQYAPTITHLKQGDPQTVARAVARSFPNISVAISGSNLVLRGPPDVVTQASAAAGLLDQPQAGLRYTQVYRLSSVDARSVASLLARSFRDVNIEVDRDLNAITVLATAHLQQRIADAVEQLDVPPGINTTPGAPPGSGEGGADSEVVNLHAAVPGTNGGPSTSATDISTTVSQALAQSAPDLHITVHPNSTRLVLTGSPRSIGLAKDLIAKLDVAEPLVELDTEVLEVDESVTKQLGFKFPTPVLSTTYSELAPVANSNGVVPQLLNLQPLTRTPLTLGAELDFLVSTSKARILEDPRITTFSGRTASLRAGETVNILTTTGGGTGTVATTQVQSFQTGVTLDITPVVNTDNYVTVTLHPSVNSEAGVSAAGVPNIQTRDTTTTIGLQDGETIVVGGLIEDEDTRTVQKVPLLGDLPLIGKLFQDAGVSHTRNELIITVTPHILKPGMNGAGFGPPLPPVPSPEPLPTLEPTATIPPHMNASGPQPAPINQTPTNLVSPPPSAAPKPSSSPGAVPTEFGQTNTFTFGTAPPNNYADPNQPPQIFFVKVSPTVVRNGQPVTISAITTTNVSTLSFGATAESTQLTLSPIGPGKWQSTFNINTVDLQSTSGNVNELLTATTASGGSTSLRIPFSLVPQ